MENLKSRPPTTEMKLQLMQALAQEFSVKWDSQLLEEQLRNPSTITHVSSLHQHSNFCQGTNSTEKLSS